MGAGGRVSPRNWEWEEGEKGKRMEGERRESTL